MFTPTIRFGAICALVACNSGPEPSGGDSPAAMHGLAIQHHITDRGVVDRPRDLTTASFAVSPTGSPVTGTAQGAFDLPAAAGGSPWLEIRIAGDRLFVPRGNQVPDLSSYRLGRPDALSPAAATPVHVALAGLDAWQAGDSLQVVAANAGAVLSGPELEASYPATGATAVQGPAIDWKTAFAPLVDAGAGDTTWVTQLTAASAGAVHYSALTRAGIAQGFALRDGLDASLAATLAPVAPVRSLALHLQGSQFAALRAQVGPGAGAAPMANLAIRALPAALAQGGNLSATFFQGLPGLVEFGPLAGSADVDAAVAFGDPFGATGASWTELAAVVYAFPVPVPMTSAHAVGSLSAMVVQAAVVGGRSDAQIAPEIAPVRDVQIAGQSLDAPVTGVGTTPTVAWAAPAIGAATSYAVAVHSVEATRSGVAITKLATLLTRSTSIALPASLMTAGGSYVLTITAISAPGADPTTRPFVGALPFASADHVTALVTP